MKRELLIGTLSAIVACVAMPTMGVYGLLLGCATLVGADLMFNDNKK